MWWSRLATGLKLIGRSASPTSAGGQRRRFEVVRDLGFLVFLRADAFRAARSGSFFFPVSRFHSSNVSFEIFPSTSSCANLRRCA
jgi:hypothetical protein